MTLDGDPIPWRAPTPVRRADPGGYGRVSHAMSAHVLPPPPLRRADDAERGAVAAGRERAGVAVGEDRGRIRHEGVAVHADRFRHCDVVGISLARLGLRPPAARLPVPVGRVLGDGVARMWSIAQNRLTAVGRVSAITSQLFTKSAVSCRVPVAVLFFTPSASPIAAATPIEDQDVALPFSPNVVAITWPHRADRRARRRRTPSRRRRTTAASSPLRRASRRRAGRPSS